VIFNILSFAVEKREISPLKLENDGTNFKTKPKTTGYP